MRSGLAQLRDQLSVASGQTKTLQEWEIPREIPEEWPEAARPLHEAFWKARVARQREIDASIAGKADHEYLYDKPCEDKKKVRVAGPFTVESLSPHRLLGVNEDDELIDQADDRARNVAEAKLGYGDTQDFTDIILDNLKTSGVQQAHKEDRIAFSSLRPWPGELVCAEGSYGRRHFGHRPPETRRHLHRPGIWHRFPSRSGRSRPGSLRCRLRRPDRLRLQLRRPRLGVQQAGPHSHPQGPHERRPPHGRRPQEHRQRQPLRHLRRAGYYSGQWPVAGDQLREDGSEL